MEIIIVAMIVIAIGATLIGGTITGANGRAPAITLGSNENSENCEFLCNQWDLRRQERCSAEAAARAAQRKVDNLRTQWGIAMATAVVLAAAAYAASLIPIYGWIVAAVLGAAAAAAFLAATFILGNLSAAGDELGAAERVAATARAAEAEARALMATRCPAQAGACFSRPSPC